MKRITIAEISRESGLSRATIDRALNDRPGVHPRTRALVARTVERLQSGLSSGFSAASDVKVDLVLRLGRGFMRNISVAAEASGHANYRIHDMYQSDEDAILGKVRELCKDTTRALVVTVKNTTRIVGELAAARARGKRVVAFASDINPDARDYYVGMDDRHAGESAAYLIGMISGVEPTRVGVVLGDYAFRCHEDREIGFRSCLRENFPSVSLADIAKGEDSPSLTYQAVRRLIGEERHIKAIYNVAGGNDGLARAVQEAQLTGKITIVTHDVNFVTVPLVKDGIFNFLISQNPKELFEGIMARATSGKSTLREATLVDFGVYTRFNLPSWAKPPLGELLAENPM